MKNKELLTTILSLIILCLTIIFVVKSMSVKDELDDVKQELAMTEALYEAKLDWYELQYNIDFDDVPNEFLLWLMEEHPDVYEYYLEE
jgi:hypothetical protein